MGEQKWRRCLDCKKAIFDIEETPCFKCGSSNFEEITRSQLLKIKEENPKSGIIIQTRRLGAIL